MNSLTVGDCNEVTLNPVLSKEASRRQAYISVMEKYVYELVQFKFTSEYSSKDSRVRIGIDNEITRVQHFITKQKLKYNP